jgi:hypothetical protein
VRHQWVRVARLCQWPETAWWRWPCVRRAGLREAEFGADDGPASDRLAALICQHATQERDEAIAARMGKLLRQARRKASTAAGGAGTESPSGTQRARGRKRAS